MSDGAYWSVVPPDGKTASTPPDKMVWAPPLPKGVTVNGMDPAVWELTKQFKALTPAVKDLREQLQALEVLVDNDDLKLDDELYYGGN